MASASRHFLLARMATGSGLAVAVTLTGILLFAWRRLPLPPASRVTESEALEFAVADAGIAGDDVWAIMTGETPAPSQRGNPAVRQPKFRLAGTFSVEGADGRIQRKAVLDELENRQQSIVGEGDTLAGALVERIFYDHVTLRMDGATEDVWLDFGRVQGMTAMATHRVDETNGVAVATNFLGGVQLQPDRWQFSRQRLLDYYQEVLDEPDRMVAIFDSLKPVRGTDSRISGYVVGVEGEGDFFQAVGLRNGDVVRKVNSVPMTSRRRAEFFIDEFLKDRMNVVVLDIEREGQPAKHVYMVRP